MHVRCGHTAVLCLLPPLLAAFAVGEAPLLPAGEFPAAVGLVEAGLFAPFAAGEPPLAAGEPPTAEQQESASDHRYTTRISRTLTHASAEKEYLHHSGVAWQL